MVIIEGFVAKLDCGWVTFIFPNEDDWTGAVTLGVGINVLFTSSEVSPICSAAAWAPNCLVPAVVLAATLATVPKTFIVFTNLWLGVPVLAKKFNAVGLANNLAIPFILTFAGSLAIGWAAKVAAYILPSLPTSPKNVKSFANCSTTL